MRTEPHPANRDQWATLDVQVLDAIFAQRRPTVRSIARRCRASTWATLQSLGALRAHGLVAWETGQKATIRPLCRVVAATVDGKLTPVG